MKQIRRSVFETNSSSTHSVSISNKNSHMANKACLSVDWDDFVHVEFGSFGWEQESYTEPYIKLQYLVTMLIETEGDRIACKEELLELDGFKLINDAVAEYCDCSGIYIDSEFSINTATWCSDGSTYVEHDGYIDHQSCEDYFSVEDFLNNYGVTATDFIFNTGIVLITDNDNY